MSLPNFNFEAREKRKINIEFLESNLVQDVEILASEIDKRGDICSAARIYIIHISYLW